MIIQPRLSLHGPFLMSPWPLPLCNSGTGLPGVPAAETHSLLLQSLFIKDFPVVLSKVSNTPLFHMPTPLKNKNKKTKTTYDKLQFPCLPSCIFHTDTKFCQATVTYPILEKQSRQQRCLLIFSLIFKNVYSNCMTILPAFMYVPYFCAQCSMGQKRASNPLKV